jgi:hypothetical protein
MMGLKKQKNQKKRKNVQKMNISKIKINDKLTNYPQTIKKKKTLS